MEKPELIHLRTTEEWGIIDLVGKSLTIHSSISDDKLTSYTGGLAAFDAGGRRLALFPEENGYVTLREPANRYPPITLILSDIRNRNYKLALIQTGLGAKLNDPVMECSETLFKIIPR